jgi:hypothetical protein
MLRAVHRLHAALGERVLHRVADEVLGGVLQDLPA